MKSLLFLVILSVCLFNVGATYGSWGDSLPDFERFNFGSENRYYASGIVTNALEVGDAQPSLFTSFAIDGPAQKFDWNLTESSYYLRADGAYITFSALPGLCFSVPGWNFSAQVYGWSSLRRELEVKMKHGYGSKDRYVYHGKASDLGTCCDDASATVFVDDFNRIHALMGTQFYGPFGGAGVPVRNTIVNTRLVHNYFRPVLMSDFHLPAECSAPIASFCTTFYESFSFCNAATNTAVPLHF